MGRRRAAVGARHRQVTVLVLCTLDTKGEECRFLRERIRALGCETITVDTGVIGRPGFAAEVARERVAAAAGTTLDALVAEADRGSAVEAMAEGAAAVVAELFQQGAFNATIALGGSSGATIAARAMARLPVGVPKLIVSTVAAGDTRPFVSGGDLALLYPVVDLAGLNRITEQVLANAAAAIAGMAKAPDEARPAVIDRPVVAMTMFGITTPCVDAVRALLDARGYEALVFSANGVGGDSMERMVADGTISGVLDLTTTELADGLVGGKLTCAGPRLEAAGRLGIPQVVSLGALDVVNFGPWDTVPARFRQRRLHRHNAAVTLMRTSPKESAELGRTVAHRLNKGNGPRTVLIPLRGLSALSAPGSPLHDPEADRALFAALRAELSPDVDLIEIDASINDPEVAVAAADLFDASYRTHWATAAP